jgi:glutamate 5-kinase
MSVIVIGGGPRPNARIVGIVEDDTVAPGSFAIVDGNELVAIFAKRSHADALLPLIKSGD